MFKKLCLSIISILLIFLLIGCSNKELDSSTTTTQSIPTVIDEKLIGTFDSEIGESGFSGIYLNSNNEIIVTCTYDNMPKYNYNITKQETTNEKTENLSSSSDTDFSNMKVEISLRGTNILIKDKSTDEIINQIPTHLNSNSTPTEDFFILESEIAIDVYNDYVYMVNENGIFRAKYDDKEFECILDSSDVKYLDIANYKDFADQKYPLNQVMGYEIFVVSDDTIYISTRMGDNIGYGYIKYYVEYGLE